MDLKPNKIIRRNLDFLKDNQHRYDVYSTILKTRKNIKRVEEKSLKQIIDGFPTNEDLPQQSAYWMTALIGNHFFPDANLRTSFNTLEYLYKTNDIIIPDWETEDIPGKDTEKIPSLNIDMSNFDSKETELYKMWLNYFEKVLD
ncbi:MAG: hypothetical protein ABEK59_03055 [Halobacteria archaeon]